jgi:exodeoxyribonuclease VII small subunit
MTGPVDTGPSGADPGTGPPGTGDADTGPPGTGDADTGPPGTGDADTGPPGTGDADTGALGIGYADAVAELEAILAEIERDDVDVDVLAPRVRRAAALIRHCREHIGAARLDVEQIVADLDGLGGNDAPSPPS